MNEYTPLAACLTPLCVKEVAKSVTSFIAIAKSATTGDNTWKVWHIQIDLPTADENEDGLDFFFNDLQKPLHLGTWVISTQKN